jgi:hypothetical protein
MMTRPGRPPRKLNPLSSASDQLGAEFRSRREEGQRVSDTKTKPHPRNRDSLRRSRLQPSLSLTHRAQPNVSFSRRIPGRAVRTRCCKCTCLCNAAQADNDLPTRVRQSPSLPPVVVQPGVSEGRGPTACSSRCLAGYSETDTGPDAAEPRSSRSRFGRGADGLGFDSVR